MTVAVIQFPGSNCEQETLDALDIIKVKSQLIDWQHYKNLDQFSGFILPGGFSYQDRVRAGVIAAKSDIIQGIKQQSVDHKKPVLGICNGAQILVESGIFSSDSDQQNLDVIIDKNYVNGQLNHFICDWTFLRPFNASHSIFLKQFNDDDVIPIQICHEEGRFLFNNSPTSGLKYCRIDGTLSDTFPITPNGSSDGIAAISNNEGNVLAIMPHPERSIDIEACPFSIKEKAKREGLNLVNWQKLFLLFKDLK